MRAVGARVRRRLHRVLPRRRRPRDGRRAAARPALPGRVCWRSPCCSACRCSTGPRRRLRLVALLVGGQTLIHLVLSVTAGHAGDGSAATAPPPAPPGSAACRRSTGTASARFRTPTRACRARAVDGPRPAGRPPDQRPLGARADDGRAPRRRRPGRPLAGSRRAYLWTILALTGRRIVAAVLLAVPVDRAVPAVDDRAVDLAAGTRSLWLVRPDSRRGPPLLAV